MKKCDICGKNTENSKVFLSNEKQLFCCDKCYYELQRIKNDMPTQPIQQTIQQPTQQPQDPIIYITQKLYDLDEHIKIIMYIAIFFFILTVIGILLGIFSIGQILDFMKKLSNLSIK